MDSRKLIDLLRATIDPHQRQEAEKHLEQVMEHVLFTCTRLFYSLFLVDT